MKVNDRNYKSSSREGSLHTCAKGKKPLDPQIYRWDSYAFARHSSNDRGRDVRSLDLDIVYTYAHFILIMQDQAAQLMDYILTPISIDLRSEV
jgi:hypothetical protein